MTVSFYEASVPVFRRYLGQLASLLAAAESHAEQHGLPADVLLQGRLAPDMLPCAVQVEVAANFALRACYPLAGLPVPAYGDFESTIEGLRLRLQQVVALLNALNPISFAASEACVIEDSAGNGMVSLEADVFLFQYALPNFFFHVAMAYAILRHSGVAIGKADFDGFHSYTKIA